MLKLSPTRTVIRGDSDRFRITFTKKVSSTKTGKNNCSCLTGLSTKEQTYPIDITGWQIRFTVRPDVPSTTIGNDEDALISEEATILDAEKGVAMIYVKSEDTAILAPGDYLYDIQVIKPVDEFGYNQVSSTRRGKYTVIGDITRNERFNIVDNSESDDEPEDDADDGYGI